jgi:hypothetical protein
VAPLLILLILVPTGKKIAFTVDIYIWFVCLHKCNTRRNTRQIFFDLSYKKYGVVQTHVLDLGKVGALGWRPHHTAFSGLDYLHVAADGLKYGLFYDLQVGEVLDLAVTYMGVALQAMNVYNLGHLDQSRRPGMATSEAGMGKYHSLLLTGLTPGFIS